jgi:hypothetical protein
MDKPLVSTGLPNHEWSSSINPNTGKPFCIVESPTRPSFVEEYDTIFDDVGKQRLLKIDKALLKAFDLVSEKYKVNIYTPGFKSQFPIRIRMVPFGYFDQSKFSRYAGDPERGKRHSLTVTSAVRPPVIFSYPEMFPEWIAHELLHCSEDIYNIPRKARDHAWIYFIEEKVADYLR